MKINFLSNIKKKYVPFTFYNYNSVHPSEISINNILARNDGQVSHTLETFDTIRCSPSVDKTQWQCNLKYMSWIYLGDEVDLQSPCDRVTFPFDNNFITAEWKIENNNFKRNVKVYPCCDEDYIDITYSFTLVRRN